MDKALKFLESHKDIALATVGLDNKPKLRVFEIMKMEGKELYFATSTDKEIYEQLQANPALELLAMEGNVSVRVAGTANFDVPEETGKQIYEGNDTLKHLYDNYQGLVYFTMDISQVDYYDLSPTPPVLESDEL